MNLIIRPLEMHRELHQKYIKTDLLLYHLDHLVTRLNCQIG